MLLEATIALLILMGITWAAAIWASYQEKKEEQIHSLIVKIHERKAA